MSLDPSGAEPVGLLALKAGLPLQLGVAGGLVRDLSRKIVRARR